MTLDRFKKYRDKFTSPEPKEAKKTLGDDIAEQLQHTVKAKLDAMMPHYVNSGHTMIHVNAASFWTEPQKYVTVTVLVVFNADVTWKDGG